MDKNIQDPQVSNQSVSSDNTAANIFTISHPHFRLNLVRIANFLSSSMKISILLLALLSTFMKMGVTSLNKIFFLLDWNYTTSLIKMSDFVIHFNPGLQSYVNKINQLIYCSARSNQFTARHFGLIRRTYSIVCNQI